MSGVRFFAPRQKLCLTCLGSVVCAWSFLTSSYLFDPTFVDVGNCITRYILIHNRS